MAWSVLQSNSATISGQTVTVTLGTTPTTGNKIILMAGCDSTATTTFTSADGNSNALTQLITLSNTNGGGVAGALFAYDVPATPTATIKATGSNAGANVYALAMEVSGLVTGNTTAMLDGSAASSTGATLTFAAPTYSSTAASEFLLAGFTDNGGPETWAANTTNGWSSTTITGINNNSLGDVGIAYKNSTGGAENAGFNNMTGSACGWISFMVAFKITGGGGPVSASASALTGLTPDIPPSGTAVIGPGPNLTIVAFDL